LDIEFHTPSIYTQTNTHLAMPRPGQKIADPNRLNACRRKSRGLLLSYSVFGALLLTGMDRRTRFQHSSSSSSIPTVCIQPVAQSVIHLHGEKDHSHQITLAYREPDGSGRSPASNASSIHIYTCVVDALAIGASLEEFSVNVVNSTYQFILRTHTLRGHPTDMARIALISPHLRGRGVSTPTVLIANLAEALQATVEHLLQSSDTFDVNSPL
jgi:hypothetical protein